MSDFSQFFSSTTAASSGGGMNIFSGIKPPKFAATGNLQNINTLDGKTDSFLIPSLRGKLLALNVVPDGTRRSDITVGTWDTNVLVWEITANSLGASAVIHGVVYNNVLDKYYTAISGADSALNNGLFELNITTGAKTKLSDTLPEFMSASGLSAGGYSAYNLHEGSVAHVDSDGNYIWRVGDTIKKFDTNFTAIQTRTLDPQFQNRTDWYYTDDMTTRVRYASVYNGAISASGTSVQSSDHFLVIERGQQRRLVNVSSRDVFNAGYRNDYHPSGALTLPTFPNSTLANHVKSIAPMAPTVTTAPFFGDGIRLGLETRNEPTSMGDAFLVDRIDYNRWISDIADASGMRQAVEVYYGGWVNV
jgi:hypothetical protein